jgi:hypothetical protein
MKKKRNMTKLVKCFVAYPSTPPYISETIASAISAISKSGNVEMVDWKSTEIGGRFIINAILEKISECEIFFCDLTNLNHNVLFELGYAIAQKKRILIFLDTNIEKSTKYYERLKILTTVGYCSYSNSKEIQNSFYNEKPYETLDKTIFKEAIENVIAPGNKNPFIFYLKSKIDTEASIKLSQLIDSKKMGKIIDDPKEMSTQSLSWYAQKVNQSSALVVHFLSNEHLGHEEQNAKNSLIAGLAKGFNIPLLMLVHSPYNCPIDYRDMMKVHQTANECTKFAKEWLNEIEYEIFEEQQKKIEFEKVGKAVKELQNITIGEPFAENESIEIENYFIETSAYNEALNSQKSIFVGRKGVGKTAILYKLAKTFKADKRNHVCKIAPVEYELDGIIRMLKQAIPKSEKGYLLESFWKFLIYTELAKSVYEKKKEDPIYTQSDDERELIEYVEENEKIIINEFSIRLENAVMMLQDLGNYRDGNEQRLKISEHLHTDIIPKLRILLGKVFSREAKCEKVSVLVDNLDRAWDPKSTDLPELSKFLLALINASSGIVNNFAKSSLNKKPVNLILTIFLRSDIYYKILQYSPERDKILPSNIVWEDSSLLLRVIEERFYAATGLPPNSIWEKYFAKEVKGVPIKKFLIENILPRPRDIIALCKMAKENAINRRHTRVEEDDLLDALKNYSAQAIETLEVEGKSFNPKFQDLIYEFIGSSEVLSNNKILDAIKNCGICEEKFDEIVDLLCYLTFLGREVNPNHFEYQYNDSNEKKIKTMARKTADNSNDGIARFKIHKAYHKFLEISQ